MNRFLTILLLLVGSTLLLDAQSESRSADYLIKNVRVFDGETTLPNRDVAIRGDRIIDVGQELDYQADTLVDGSGKTLIPGLINAHVHAWFPLHLQEAATAGVLTLLDMHGSVYQLNFFRKSIPENPKLADYFGAGSGATVPGGHGTQYGMPVPTIDSSLTAEQFVHDRAAEKVDYIKILREPSRPTVSYEQIDTIIRTAHSEELLAVAHISKAADAPPLAERQIDGLVHMWNDTTIADAGLDQLESADLFIVPTALTIVKVADYYKDKRSSGYLDSLAILKELGRLIERDIPLLAGTDPPNFSINYGTDLYRELELFVAAGMTPLEALRSATSRTANAFQLLERGAVKPGYLAHLVLIDGNPTERISDLEAIDSVWKAGIRIVQN